MCNRTEALRAAFALSFLALIGVAQEKTEVTVQKGEVRVHTPSATTTIVPGQKATLASGAPIKLEVDNPEVKDLLAVDKCAEEEKRAKRIPINGLLVAASYVESDRLWKLASISEVPNRESSPSNTCRIGLMGIHQNPKYYDMEGRELRFDLQPVTKTTGYYHLHFPNPVPPGEKFRFIKVSGFEVYRDLMWQEGKVWYVWQSNGSNNFLNYFRFVLPRSAILLDTFPRPVAVDQVDGRTAVTIRTHFDGRDGADCVVAFLWPERDGTTFADVPPEYRGLRNERDAALAEEYEREKAKIRSGARYCDQSTPVRALLTWCCGIAQRDKALYVNSSVESLTEDSMKQEKLEMDVAGWTSTKTRTEADQQWRWRCKHFVDDMTFLSTPAWPDAPSNGYLHPVFVSRPGSMMRDHMHALVYVDGKWYRAGNTYRRHMTDPNSFGRDLPADVPPPPQTAEEFVTRSGYGRGSNEKMARAYSDKWLVELEPRSLCKAGLALYDVKRYEEALAAFKKASEKLQTQQDAVYSPLALLWQGHMLDLMGRREEAVSVYKTVAQMNVQRTFRQDQFNLVYSPSPWAVERIATPFVRVENKYRN